MVTGVVVGGVTAGMCGDERGDRGERGLREGAAGKNWKAECAQAQLAQVLLPHAHSEEFAEAAKGGADADVPCDVEACAVEFGFVPSAIAHEWKLNDCGFGLR